MATPVDATTVSVTTDATPITTATCVVPAGDGAGRRGAVRDRVCSGEVDAHPAGARREEENRHAGVLSDDRGDGS